MGVAFLRKLRSPKWELVVLIRNRHLISPKRRFKHKWQVAKHDCANFSNYCQGKLNLIQRCAGAIHCILSLTLHVWPMLDTPNAYMDGTSIEDIKHKINTHMPLYKQWNTQKEMKKHIYVKVFSLQPVWKFSYGIYSTPPKQTRKRWKNCSLYTEE